MEWCKVGEAGIGWSRGMGKKCGAGWIGDTSGGVGVRQFS